MRSFTPDVLAFGHLATLQAKMDVIDALMEEISLLVSDLIVNYRGQMDAVREKYWTDLMVVTEAKTKAYIFSMQTKADEVRRNEVSNESVSSANDSIELKRQELQIKERVLAAQEKANSDRLSETLRDAGNKKTAAIKKAQNKVDAILDDCVKLAAKLDDLGDPEEVSDLVLGRVM